MDQNNKSTADIRRQRIEDLQNKNKIKSGSLLSEEEIQKLDRKSTRLNSSH